jgi:glutathione S-transferase
MRPWLALTHAGADFVTETAQVELGRQSAASQDDASLAKVSRDTLRERREKGSITGLFPVLHVAGTPIHESLAICEWVNETYPEAGLHPDSPLLRARARAIACEMVGGFSNLRTQMSCHLFGRVTNFRPNAATQLEIERVFELWQDALERSGGPFLFGRFGIADAMFYPVRTRFRSYGVPIPAPLQSYVQALDAVPAVRALEAQAQHAPAIPAYDAYLRELGGDPLAALAR